ncbi:OmpA family protein [Lutibacter holmesii]|uniref:OmpA family protein n=1 Tax=Lutibacter holmesii TaxID=1137985 RepID=A0ABW3WK97_9FLAO
MKTNTNFYIKLFIIGFLFCAPQQIEAQFLKKLQKHAEEKIEREAQKRAERKVDETIDQGFDEIEDTIDGKNTSINGKGNSEKQQNSNTSAPNFEEKSTNSSVNNEAKAASPNVVWSRFDFVPGDTVIFEDGPSIDEENGEFPSRWDLFQGGAEIMEVDSEPVITFITDVGNMHSKGIVPYLKNSKEDYLPEVFTIEFDLFFNPSVYNERYYLTFYDRKNQPRSGTSLMTFYVNKILYKATEGSLSNKDRTNKDEVGGWRHVSIAYTKGKLKVYFEDERLINIPHLEGDPTGITFSGGSENMFFKNFRIANGGVKYYDKVLTDGKIIVNGIKFDTNKATLKPESIGPINKIFELMQKQPDLNFSVEGHTDSDGDEAHNQTLSEERGKAVMNQLITMGIQPNRLKSTGFGESKPIDNNSTPEGKANNRRVEFVKFSGKSNTTSATINSSENTVFDQLTEATIEAKMKELPDSFNIPISNNSGIVNGKGTIILYQTSVGDYGKLQILDVDKYTNTLNIKHVTYAYKGGVKSKSNNLQIQGTYTCDLDKGTSENVLRSDEDFWFQVKDKKNTSINPKESAIFKILK